MRVTIVAVGRLRSGPERDLVEEYLRRFERTGRPNGLGPARIIEVEDRKRGGAAFEADLLRAACPEAGAAIALDERGKTLSSLAFAELLRSRADAGLRDLGFLIGGADGLAEDLRSEADVLLSFGPMVWPHMLARVMLSEQLYRAASILAGTPYHRA
jgi:23S rRNA (pseudouridine1915-N3)-methyltransferase